MNLAIVRKTMTESLLGFTVTFFGLIAFVILLSWAMVNMGTELLDVVSKLPWLQKILEMSLGISFEGEVSMNMMFAFGFTHLVVFILAWSVIVSIATRVTVGESERGTADLLLTLPVTRSEVFFSTSIVWWIVAALISLAPLIGVTISAHLFQSADTVTINRFVAPAINLFCLNLAVGGFATLFGCCFSRRSVALGAVVALVCVSVALNFVEPFIEAVSRVKWLSLLTFYRPVETVRTGDWPIAHMIVLLAIGLTTWAMGWLVYCRKDVPTA